jgi:hypothetical protein
MSFLGDLCVSHSVVLWRVSIIFFMCVIMAVVMAVVIAVVVSKANNGVSRLILQTHNTQSWSFMFVAAGAGVPQFQPFAGTLGFDVVDGLTLARGRAVTALLARVLADDLVRRRLNVDVLAGKSLSP